MGRQVLREPLAGPARLVRLVLPVLRVLREQQGRPAAQELREQPAPRVARALQDQPEQQVPLVLPDWLELPARRALRVFRE